MFIQLPCDFQAGTPGWHSDTSTAENPAQQAHEGGQGSSNMYEMYLDSSTCTGRPGCRAQREGRVWPSTPFPHTSPSFPPFTDLSYPSCCACRSGSTVPAVSRVSGASASFPPRGLACQLSSCISTSTTSAVVPLAGRGSVCLRLTRHREASSFQPPGCGQKEQKRSQGSHCARTDGHGQPALKHQVPPHPAPCPPQQPAECHGSSKALPGQKAASSSHHIPLLTRPHRRQKPSVVSSEDKALLLLPVAVQEGAVDCDHFSLAGKDSTFGASGLFILLIWLIRIWAQSKRSQ